MASATVEALPGVFGSIEKSPRIRVDVYASEYNGKEYLHVREHFLSDDGNEWLPSKKGITLRESVQIEELITALRNALGHF